MPCFFTIKLHFSILFPHSSFWREVIIYSFRLGVESYACFFQDDVSPPSIWINIFILIKDISILFHLFVCFQSFIYVSKDSWILILCIRLELLLVYLLCCSNLAIGSSFSILQCPFNATPSLWVFVFCFVFSIFFIF